MATFQVATPSPFNFAKPEEWPKWLKRFERFCQASELCKKSEESQVNTLLYSMGEKADDILQSFCLSEEELKKYETVVAKFQKHFISKRNVIFERAKFNSRKQEEGENVDSFITALYGLAEHCGFGSLHDKLIRDRIVVGIRDIVLSEKMQMDPNLNLEKALNYVRQSEAVKKQQETVRGTPTSNFTPTDDAINVVNKARSQYKATSRSHRQSDRAKKTQPNTLRAKSFNPTYSKCTRCGKSPMHP